MDERLDESAVGGDGDDRFLAESFRALVEHTRDIVLLIAPDGRIVLANAAAESAYRRPRSELLGLTIRDLRAPSTRSEVAAQMQMAATEGLLFETVHVDADGREFPVEVSSRGVEVDGRPYLLSVIRDITARRARERERDELVSDLEAANRQLEGLLRIVSSTVGRVDIDSLIPEVLAALREVMDAQSALFFVLRDGYWHLTHQSGFPGADAGTFSMAAGDGFASQVAAAGEPLWSANVRAGAAHIDAHDEYGITAMFGIPLYVEGRLFGVLECTWTDERLVSEAESVMLRVAADRIMTAILGAQRFESTSRLRDLEASLAEASARLAASHDLEETVPGALAAMAEALDCDGAVFGDYRDGTFRPLFSHRLECGIIDIPDHPRRSSSVEGPLPVVHVRQGTASAEWLHRTLQLSEALIVPVRVRGEWFGAIVFGRWTPRGGFDPAVDEYLARLSLVLSLAYANATDFNAEHLIAETLQESLLALEPEVHGVDFDFLYRSSTLAMRVGGDFYDLFPMPEGRVGVLVGDVSGKGIEAAAFTALVKHTVRAFTHESLSPSAIFERANRALCAQARMRDFASAVLAVIDPSTGEGRYCRAGHPPGLIVRADGSVEEMACASPVLGAFTDVTFEDEVFALGPADLLVLYTDGVTEARDAHGGFFGEERLIENLVACAGRRPAEAMVVIDTAVREFSGERRSDDMAIVMLTRS